MKRRRLPWIEQSLGDADVPFAENTPGSNLIGIDPRLGPLAQNGGFGATHRPAPTSPVVDKGATMIPQDQRQLPRPVDIPHVPNSAAGGADGADIGAIELTLAEGPPEPVDAAVTPHGQSNPVETSPARKRCAKRKKGAVAAKKRRACRKRKGKR